MNPDRIKIEHKQNHFVVVLDGGADYLKEYSITEFGEKVAWQLAATYREGFMDGSKFEVDFSRMSLT